MIYNSEILDQVFEMDKDGVNVEYMLSGVINLQKLIK